VIRAIRSSLKHLLDKGKVEGSILSLELVPPKMVARSGKLSPALGRRDVGTAARQRVTDLPSQD
jgi:hypothetical protein